MRMEHNQSTKCLHEDQIQGQSRKIAELEARADYKDKRIDELKIDMHELKESIEKLETTITNFILKSVNDDSDLKEYINKLENRVTSLESRQDTIYKLVIAIPTFLAILGAIAVYIK